MKSLYDVSWKILEEEYRQDPALSYSTLAKYERTGFNELDHLFDRVDTPSLTFGSAVDSIITGGLNEFTDRFIVADFPSVPESIVKIVKSLFKQYGGEYRSLLDIPNDKIIRETESQGYQMNWKPETRAKVIKEKGVEYYNLLFIAGDKTILDTQTYQDVMSAVSALKDNKATRGYFQEDNPFDSGIERLYQLKFKACLEGINYRCMADLIIVNHDTKEIFLIDLKTSSHTEWDFHTSFKDWFYWHQARLYYRIIKANLEKDDYFKDFIVHDYRFIVVNKKTLTPLVWEYKDTKKEGTLYYGKNKQFEVRDPFEIGKELNYYLSSRPSIPIDITMDTPNDLIKWLNTL